MAKFPYQTRLPTPVAAACIALILISPWATAATKIYKTVDADGNVVYSDVAPAQRESESQLQVEELNTYPTPEPATAELPVVVLTNPDDLDQSEEIPAYSALGIASPANDEAVRANDGNIVLTAAVEPGLHGTHQLRFFLDGQPVGTLHGTSLPLNNVDRGTHQAKVAILDASANVLMESEPVTFHLLRYFKRSTP